MRKTEKDRPAHRFTAALTVALVLLALVPGIARAGEAPPRAEESGPASSAIAGLDGLWGALTDAWNDLGRRFAATGEEGAGESSDTTSTDGTGPSCDPACDGPPDIDPNG